MAANIYFTSQKSDVKIHDYLYCDILLYIFQLIADKNPKQAIASTAVCVQWKNLICEDRVWQNVAKRLTIINERKKLYFEIAELLKRSQNAIKLIDKQTLTSGEREWMFKALNTRIARLPNNLERKKLVSNYNKSINERTERMEKLRAAFYGHLSLSAVGLSNREKAKEIAQILASDRYLDKKPINEFSSRS